MNLEEDEYRTVNRPSIEILYKEKKSKFYGYVFPVTTEEEIKEHIENLRKLHPTANHVCYAWQMGVKNITYRANDDGEPNNSAGMPIYGQIQSFEVTNVLVAVARVFGGTKLGVGGLISAYKSAAQEALQASQIITKTLKKEIELKFAYDQMDLVMRTIKQKNLDIVSQQMNLDCELIISVRQKNSDAILSLFQGMYQIDAKLIETRFN